MALYSSMYVQVCNTYVCVCTMLYTSFVYGFINVYACMYMCAVCLQTYIHICISLAAQCIKHIVGINVQYIVNSI